MEKKQRRPKGTGSVSFHKASGKWVAKYNGRTVYCDTEPQAKKAVKQLIVAEGEEREALRHIKSTPAGHYTSIEEAVKEFIDYKSLSLKDTSLDRIEQIAKCHIIPRIGMFECAEFTDMMYYEKLIVPMIREDLSFSSIKKVQDLMFPFCRWCNVPSRRYMDHDPLIGVEKLSQAVVHSMKVRYGVESPEDVEDEGGDHSNVVALTAEQRQRFVDACRSRYKTGLQRFPHGEAFVLMMYTGLRVGEMCALRWQDVDLENRKIRVKANLSGVTCRDPNSPQFGRKVSRVSPYTKTNRPRTVPLGDMAYESIIRLYEHRMPGCPLVVFNRDGDLVDPVTIQSSLRKIYDLAKIKLPSGVNAHALRHTFASMCFESGMNVKEVSDLLGHKSTQLTIDTYIHFIGDVNLDSMPKLTDLR